MTKVERIITLRTLDFFWMDHLDTMEHLRDSVRLRAYGQQDPLVEYKTEGHQLFRKLLGIIESATVQSLFKAEIKKEPIPTGSPVASFPKTKEKPGRNDPCPCGAKHPDGRPIKYKHCHGK